MIWTKINALNLTGIKVSISDEGLVKKIEFSKNDVKVEQYIALDCSDLQVLKILYFIENQLNKQLELLG